MDFSSFKLTECGTSAQTRVAEGRRTENGVHVEYYISTHIWDNGSRDYHEFRRIVRAFDGDDILYRRLCGLFDNCGVGGWANFHGKNPQYVLDGESMSFCLVLPDGTEIKAGGTNNFPKNYGRFSEELHEMITTEKISSTVFSDGTYQITLPESWVGNVSAEFSDGMVTFSFDRDGGGKQIFFIIDNDSNGYSSPSYKGRTEVGRLISGGDVRYVTMRDHYPITSPAAVVPEALLELRNNYKNDRLAIIESLRGVNGYKFFPEDGAILYYANAMDLADKARSLWLSLNFAGEYPCSAKPIKIRWRNYVPMFPPYDYTDTVEKVRKKFLKVFSEEFTDKTLNRAVADRELIERKGNVYVLCKKRRGEASYNSSVDSVRDEGGGKFTVVIAVRMPPDGKKHFVDLPAEKNAAGEFVLTDYPYWEKSE